MVDATSSTPHSERRLVMSKKHLTQAPFPMVADDSRDETPVTPIADPLSFQFAQNQNTFDR